VVLDFELI